MGCFLQSAILPRRYMLRERQGAPEPASRLQVRNVRSLDPSDPWHVFQKLKSSLCRSGLSPLVSALVGRPNAFPFSASTCVSCSGDPRPLAEPGPF